MGFNYLKGISNYEDELIKYRRHLHQFPEPSYEEVETSQYVFDQLSQLSNTSLVRPTKTSVIAIIKGDNPGGKIGLRADLDALRLQEERSDIEFKSRKKGLMHACGHDGHTAMLLSAASWLSQHTEYIYGEVYCIFQHAEEAAYGGAQELIKTGYLDSLDFIYGQHMDPSVLSGQVDLKAGVNTSNTDSYRITIQAKGGHASQPHESIDPVMIGSELVNAFQTIVSRNVPPTETAVVSNTYFEAGNSKALNVIPDFCKLGGSVRTFSQEVTALINKRMDELLDGITRAHGATYQFEWIKDCPSVINNSEKTADVVEIAKKIEGLEVVSNPPSMVGEDFAEYCHKFPAVFAWIGTRNEEKNMTAPLHHPMFAIDEDVLLNGVKLLVSVAIEQSKKYKK